MKKVFLPALFFVFALAIPQKADAQALVGIGGHIGVNVDEGGNTFLGAQARLGTAAFPFVIQPGVDFGIGDFDYVRAEGNLLWYIGRRYTSTFTPYIGPGISLLFQDDEAGDSEMDLGVNAVGGIEFRPVGPGIVPYVQARYTFQPGSDPLGLMGGLLFQF